MKKIARSIHEAGLQDKSDWNSLVRHPLQSWEWGEFRKKTGIDVVRLKDEDHGKFTDGWQLTFHKLPHLPYTIGYFPKGPLPTQEMLETLEILGKEKHTIFIQLEPNVQKPTSYNLQPLVLSHHPLFPKFTFVLDLTLTEDQLFSSFHPKTRYNIKLAQKHGVIIKNDHSPQAFNQYLQLTNETTRRQGFYAHNENYHREMWSILSKAKIAHLWTASYKGNILAAWIIFVWHDTIYYPYGASSRINREVMAPNLLLWEIARWGKREGCKKFDLWGALGPNPDQSDPWFGFHRFKEGYRPRLVEFIGSYDLVLNPIAYQLYRLADIVRWNLLKQK